MGILVILGAENRHLQISKKHAHLSTFFINSGQSLFGPLLSRRALHFRDFWGQKQGIAGLEDDPEGLKMNETIAACYGDPGHFGGRTPTLRFSDSVT